MTRCTNCQLDGITTDVCPRCGARQPVLRVGVLPGGSLLSGGAFRIDTVVSQDATTVTYRALDTASHEHVAVTELFPRYTGRHPIDQTLVVRVQAEQRFLNEKNDFLRTARGLASVRTRALVSVRAIFEENGTAYLVTELPDGGSLAAELSRRGQPFTEDGVFEIAQEVCTALEKLHGQSLLHLNVRPCSILRRLDGGIVLLTHGISGLDDQDVAH
jgi:serine/threonine protein kinase